MSVDPTLTLWNLVARSTIDPATFTLTRFPWKSAKSVKLFRIFRLAMAYT